MTARALINVPKKAKRGDVIEIKTLISHVMETGFRTGTNGHMIPRDIITSFACAYNGETIFETPFVTFYTIATDSGTLAFRWIGDNGFEVTQEAKIVVE
jgi:sulfur-oxidizing protein SoxZ